MGHGYLAVVAWGAIIPSESFQEKFPEAFKAPLVPSAQYKQTCAAWIAYNQKAEEKDPEPKDDVLEEMKEKFNIEIKYDQQGNGGGILVCCEDPIEYCARDQPGEGRSFTDEELQMENLESVIDFLEVFGLEPTRCLFVYQGA